MPRHVPIELYALIFKHITSNAALSNLCMVSRTFHREAQPLLYHTVRLSTDYDRIISWCRTIAENPRLAMKVYALSLLIAFKQELGMIQVLKLQHAVKRALSSLSRLVELQIYESTGTHYVYSEFDMFCGHPFHLQVFGTVQHPCALGKWLKFLSEQPGIRHWKSNVFRGPPTDPDILPLLTSAQIYSPALDILAPCRTIRALRVKKISNDRLLRLRAFKHSLTSLSLEDLGDYMLGLEVVSDAVPNIKFLGLQLEDMIFYPAAYVLSEISSLPYLTTLVLEIPHGGHPRWPMDSVRVLSLATVFMNANPTLRRVAFEIRGSWTNGRWPCYIRASDSHDNSTAVLEGFDILGPDSWRDVSN